MKAKPIHSIVPTKLVAVDVYGPKPPATDVLNKQPSMAGLLLKSFGSFIPSQGALLDGVINLALNGDISKKNIKGLLTSQFPNVKNVVDNLRTGVVKELASSIGIDPAFVDKVDALGRHPSKQAIESALTEQFPQLKILHKRLDPTGNSTSLIDYADKVETSVRRIKNMDTATEILGLVDQVVSSPSVAMYFDLSNEYKALSGVIRLASVFGVPEAIDKAIVKAQPENREKLVVDAFIAAASNGDYFTMQRFSKFDLSPVISKQPMIIRTIIENYKYDNTINVTRLNELVGLLNKINPTWMFSPTGINYNDLCHASVAATDLFTLDPVYAPHIIAAKFYAPIDVIDGCRISTPWAPI